ncbi:rhamnolipids biosynthesis 3-oxoacyl-reductase [Phaffia rhodozyma]|uniref:Rhamnolipids biosynthesis 3-oxoacyl-reductase n=1 Tax=Phaffia rhodozyma TaxID=264483 RepID=A0A0F7SRF2_PHARH|nr:rhamnolipids biosynthesis 3-oxoacyl-reductase [Phaffia rhodozyma]
MSYPTALPDVSTKYLFDVKDKVILVTGGSSGLGTMMAASFVQNGAKVYIASRKLTQLQEVTAQLNGIGKSSNSGGSCAYFVADLGTKAGCDSLVSQLKEKESSLDVLVNNSGMSWGGPLSDEFPEVGWDRVMSTNVKSIFYLVAGLRPLLRKNATALNPGKVINVSSIAGIVPSAEGGLSKPGWGVYSYATSKAAVNHLTGVLATSLAAEHINVNAIAPGTFPSKMTSFGFKNAEKELLAEQPTGRVGMAEDMAGLAMFLASRASSHVTGAIIPVDGGARLGAESVKTSREKAKL